MFKNTQDLLDAGIINERSEFISPLTFRWLTGQESGVWFDYNPGSGDFCEVNNYDDTDIVDCEHYNAYGDEVPAILKSFYYSEKLAADVIDEYEFESIEAGAGCHPEDLEDLKSEGKKGGYWELTIEINGDEKSYYFFAPEDWN